MFVDWLASEGISGTSSVLGVALDLAINGVHVFPLVGKKPDGEITPHGVLDATDDVRTVVRWFSRRPDLNFGIAIGVGALAGVRVLDTDPRHGGDVRIAELEAKHGALPPTLTIRTGRGDGGLHRYFALPAGAYREKLFGIHGGVDFLGPGKYVVGPQSIHPETRGIYEIVVDVGIAHAPTWLVELARREERVATARFVEPPSTDIVERARRYLAKRDPAIAGSNGHTTTFVTAVLLVRGFGLDEATAYALLASDYNPRCQPPWSERELRRKVKEAAESNVDSGFLRDAKRSA